MPAGRPTDYTPELAERICEWLSGGKSLKAFCRTEGAPHEATVFRWIVAHEEFRKLYVHARQAAGYAHGDRIIHVVEQLKDRQVDPQTAKAMMDGLKWAAERMAPTTHMPQSLINHQSPDGSMTPKPTVIELVAKPVDDESPD